mmetsp:Transcript_17149/g.39607  ORF Transcript_17149/g.39607 Transcript_17149/m.39607 type:complete len:81 (-) Transcript_17149:39-281(-)
MLPRQSRNTKLGDSSKAIWRTFFLRISRTTVKSHRSKSKQEKLSKLPRNPSVILTWTMTFVSSKLIQGTDAVRGMNGRNR